MPDAIEQVANMNDKCGEAPTWDAAGNRLVWVDCESNRVHEYSPVTGQSATFSQDLMVAGIAVNRGGGFVFAGSTGLHIWQAPDRFRTVVSRHDGQDLLFNDMIADARGRVYAGTVYWGPTSMEKTGGLYLIYTDGTIRVVDEGIVLANGLGFSPDDRTLYFADSGARRIYAYDVHPDSGDLSNKRVFVQVPGDEGLPDGLTVDADGFIWSAQWYGGQIVRYDPEGKVASRVKTPMQQTSSVIFGGKELTDLYFTTAGSSWRGPLMPPGYNPDAPNIGGPLYRVRVDVKGRPEHQANFKP